MKKHIYNAAPLFTKGEIRERLTEDEKLKGLKEYTYFNPITAPCNNKSDLPTSLDIFKGDTHEVLNADIVLANLDHEDAGVMAELGMSWALSYCGEIVKTLYDSGQIDAQAVEVFNLLGVKQKKIIAMAYDLREATAGEYEGIKVPFGRNQFVIGLIEEAKGVFVEDFDEALTLLKED